MADNQGILPGGCVHPLPGPLPVPKPVPGPDPVPAEPTSLDEEVDWMSWQHPQLYDMVKTGMDLPAAGEVAYRWEQLGAELDDISTQLGEVLAASSSAWEGEAAETARISMTKLVDWTRQTSEGATNVAACLALQVENAAQARSEMPEPLVSPMPRMPSPQLPEAVAAGGTIPSGASSFSSKSFADAPQITADQGGLIARDDAVHRQAAAVMRRFQENSRQVYGKVTRFEDPTNPVNTPYERRKPDDDRRPPRKPAPEETPREETGATTTASATPTAPVAGGQQASAGGLGGGAMSGAPAGAGGTVGVSPNERGQSVPMGRFTVGGPAESQAASAGGQARGAGGMGPAGAMMPPGAGAGSGGDKDHARSSFLEEDDDLFGLGPTPPSVIGEDFPGAR